jgi:hypothetical protein
MVTVPSSCGSQSGVGSASSGSPSPSRSTSRVRPEARAASASCSLGKGPVVNFTSVPSGAIHSSGSFSADAS